MLRLFKGRKTDGDGEAAKKYKKADLGLKNQMYFSDELKMWVEKGKEAEARAEKEKLNAPPPSVGSISAASSTTSLAAMSETGAVAPAMFARSRDLKGRYVATLPGAPAAAAGNTNGSSAPPSKSLLPGMAGPKLPGIPSAAPGSGPPSFFRPTPAPSEVTSEAMGGSDKGSVSGLSGMDASFPNSRTPSQPSLFMPGPVVGPKSSSSSSGTEEVVAGAGPSDSPQEGSQELRTSSTSGAAPEGVVRQSSEGTGSALLRESDTSGSCRLPSLSGPSNISLAAWRPQHSTESSAGTAPPPPAADVGQPVRLGQQGSSSADMEADAQAQVSSPTLFTGSKQVGGQQEAGQESWSGPHSNGHSAAYSNGFYMPGGIHAAAPEPLSNGVQGADQHEAAGRQGEQAEQQPLASQLSAGWDSRPVRDPLDTSGEAVTKAAAAAADNPAWAAAQGGGYGWDGAMEGGEWQQSQAVADGTQQPQQQPQDPLATGGGWEGQQDGTAWGVDGRWEGQQQGWQGEQGGWGMQQAGWEGQQGGCEGGWQQQGITGDTEARPADPEGGAAAGDSSSAAAGVDGPATMAGSWPQQEQLAGSVQDSSYYGAYGEQQYGGQQYASEQGVYSEQYTADAAANGGYQYGAHQGQEATASYPGYYQQDGAMSVAAVTEPQAVELLAPVHPELPGIAVQAQGSGSVTSPTYGPPGSSGSRGSKGRLPRTSMPGSPLTHQTSMGALLPPPPGRLSVGGGPAGQQSLHAAGQAEAAAVVLSTPAAAGDASMLTAVRPSSPYARAVSPLSRTSTGVADAVVSKQSSGGFPIPSPPSHGGLLGRAPSGNVFIPGNTSNAGASAAPMPWQPGVSPEPHAAAPGPGVMQSLQHGPNAGLANGYDPTAAAAAAHGHWQQHGQALGLWQHQEQQVAGGEHNSSGPPVPPFMPGLLESLPRVDAQHSKQDKSSGLQSFSAAAGAGKAEGLDTKSNPRAHPYDQFLAQALSRVNWRAVHFKQPGKLNRLLPWEEFEMEQARKQEAAEQLSGEGRKSPFWYRQMEFRQKLPPGSMKPSASEPAAMPSHAINKADAAQATPSPVSTYAGWPQGLPGQQGRQQQQQQELMTEPQGPRSPLTPARAATTGAVGAVAAGGLHTQPEEPTPTSKLMPQAAGAEAGGCFQHGDAAAGDAAALQPAADGQQAAWAGWQGYGEQQQEAGDSYWQQQQYGQEYSQQYPQQQYDQQYYQQYGADQQQYYTGYDMNQWQQPAAVDADQAAGPEVQLTTQQEGERGTGTWGSPEAEMLESAGVAATTYEQQQHGQAKQQQQHEYSAAAAVEAACAWGADDSALDLQLGVPVVDASLSSAAAAIAAAAADTVFATADAATADHELHSPELVAAARAARISSSSIGLESQPSTGRAAAAAARRIVNAALENILQQHAVPEDAEQEAAAAAAEAAMDTLRAAGGDGWQGNDDEEVTGLQALQAATQEAAAEDVDGAGETVDVEQETAALPLPACAAWTRLQQQFAAAADAAAAMGALPSELPQYKEYFDGYGDYLLGALPRAALEQAGLLTEDPTAAAAAAAAAEMAASAIPHVQQQQQLDDEEQEEFFAEFGSMQIKNDTAASLFATLGYDIDTLLACCAEA